MVKKRLFVAMWLALLIGAIGATAALAGSDVAALRSATARYHRLSVAQADGHVLLEKLDHCFDSGGEAGAMGYHYIDPNQLDLDVAVTEPEAIIYESGPNGQRNLVAVEYIVPAADWDEAYSELPELYGRSFHLNEALGVYVLHVWAWKHNPAGMFADWNPDVSCP